jgi:hypothetical protein
MKDETLNAAIEANGGRPFVAVALGVSESYLSLCVNGHRTMTDTARYIIETGQAETMDRHRVEEWGAQS